MAKVYIGTSGWQYPHWQGIFYPQNLAPKDWLAFYTNHFQTVEVNATFYHQMRKETFKKWREIVGPQFVFSIKGSRFITHIKRLKDCQEEVKRFFTGVAALRSAQDVILWQLPPQMAVDMLRLKRFLVLLPRTFRQAFEFRHQSWLNQKTYSLLKDYNTALVIQDSPNWPKAEVVTADFIYLRFHGKGSLYTSCYSQAELDEWAQKMKQWKQDGRDIYAFFNNDAQGHALQNGRELKELLAS